MGNYTLSVGYTASFPSFSHGMDYDVEELPPGEHKITFDGEIKVPVRIYESGEIAVRQGNITGDRRGVRVYVRPDSSTPADELVGASTMLRPEDLGKDGDVLSVEGRVFGFQRIQGYVKLRYLRGNER